MERGCGSPGVRSGSASGASGSMTRGTREHTGRLLMYATASTSSPLMLMHAEANWPLELQPPPDAAGESLSALAAGPATYMARFSPECPGALARGVDAS